MSTPRIGSSIRMISASEPSARANSAFCWLPPDSDRIGVVDVGRADADALPASPRASAASARRIDEPAAAQRRAASAMVMFSRDRPEREDAVASAGRRRRRRPAPATSTPSARLRGRRRCASSMSVWPWPPRPARPTISPRAGDELAGRRPGAPGGAHDRALPAAARRAAPRSRASAGDAAHRLDQACRGRSAGRRGRRRRLPSRITTMRSAVERISPRRCEIRMTLPPPSTKRRTKASSWPRAVRRRARRSARRGSRGAAARRSTEKARAISPSGARPIDRSPTTSSASMPWPGKICVELARRSGAPRAAPPAEAAQRRMHDAGVLGHREVGAERQFLEDAADA